MKRERLEELLKKYREGELDAESVVREIISSAIYEDLTENIDGLRELRKRLPETIFCLKKTPEQVLRAFKRVYEAYGMALGTKARKEQYELLSKHFPEAEFYPESGIIKLGGAVEKLGYVPVVAAGSSDYTIAEEAQLTLEFLGSRSEIVIDVGVAGIHRLKKVFPHLEKANCVIVIAGMEGALPGLIAGFSPVPVIGVPASTGYGTSFGGLSALLTMLNSCAEGLAVVNIDNGFGAAVLAHMINRLVEGRRKG